MPFTPDSELELLFPLSFISPDVKRALPEGLHVRPSRDPLLIADTSQIRPLASTDYARGHLSVLSVLSQVSDPGEAAWRAQFMAMHAAPETYFSLVIVDRTTDQIIGTGTLFVERKFMRGLGRAGHIEDIAVDRHQQGKKVGLRIINALIYISETLECYKTILNCSDSNIR